MLEKNKKSNFSWILGIGGSVIVIVYTLMKFFKYFQMLIYAKYFGFDKILLDSSSINLTVGYIGIVLFVFIFYFGLVLYKSSLGPINTKNKIKFLVVYFFILGLVGWFTNLDLGLSSFIALFLYLGFIITSMLIADKETSTDDIIDDLKYIQSKSYFYFLLIPLAFILFALVIYNSFDYFSINQKKLQFTIYEDTNKVIVYATTDYYLLYDYEIENHILKINKNHYIKVTSDGLTVYYKDYDRLKVEE